MFRTSFSSVSATLDTKGPHLNAPVRNGIWVLDDDASMLKAMGRLLTSAGFAVEKFSDPADFLSQLDHAQCRVAILDVWMPDMNGLEVQACLRRDSPETRVIFMTGREDPLIRKTAIEAGAYGFLSKPFEDEALVQLVLSANNGD
jgi:FixJ family two-component response regulator